MGFKLTNADNYVHLTTVRFGDYPQICKLKAEELVEEGFYSFYDDAYNAAKDMETELELFYEKGTGLFAVESDAVESAPIYSPYTKEEGEESDD